MQIKKRIAYLSLKMTKNSEKVVTGNFKVNY